jgi:hypothetical protein
VWLPENPMYSRWRNCACDCLDVLHWAANSAIGAASGVEHPTVLHLHIARVVVLTPYQDIRKIALTKAGENILSEKAVRESREYIERWLVDDQYKARLAMIHAGVLFWHVWRHSANGYYESDAIFLATLALWAYGSGSHNSRDRSSSTSGNSTAAVTVAATPALSASQEEATSRPSFTWTARTTTSSSSCTLRAATR